MNREHEIIDCWEANAAPWVDAVSSKKIASRVRVTDKTIVDAVTATAPRKVLDVGCGEGWLTRVLTSQGIDVLGVDAVPALVEIARRKSNARFTVMSYETLANGALHEKFDAVVCNFSLLGRASVDNLVGAVPRLLHGGGSLIVQTLHPKHISAGESFAYEDGWRAGSWQGCGEGFSQPAPWYFRTMETWQALFESSGFKSLTTQEPIDPVTRQVVSVIFVAVVAI